MRGMTLTSVARACKGTLYGVDSGKELQGVVTDSRLVEEDYLFIAVPGEKVDGHNFIPDVMDKKAMAALGEKLPEKLAGPFILVEDSLQALKDIATYYREQLTIPVIGITGSVGKTSTKEFVASVLETKYKVLKTEKNYNNEIGVPLTLLRIREEHQVAVLEMGINHFGEMHRLSQMAKPDICLFTNIGDCHIEFLGDRDGILKAKTEMFDFMAKNGTVCVNADDDKLVSIEKVKGKTPIRFGMSEAYDVYATDCVSRGLFGSEFVLHMNKTLCSVNETLHRLDAEKEVYTAKVKVPLPGGHMIYNALAAASVGSLLGVSEKQIVEGIEKVQPVAGRSHIISLEDKVIIDDCYNANPVSMKAALSLLGYAEGRKVAILGDMFELGEKELELHGQVGLAAVKEQIDVLCCVGTLSKAMFEAAKEKMDNVYYFTTKEELLAQLPVILKKEDTVLLKASHGMGFAQILPLVSEMTLK